VRTGGKESEEGRLTPRAILSKAGSGLLRTHNNGKRRASLTMDCVCDLGGATGKDWTDAG